MNRQQRIALARILSDLIEADFIVEKDEIDYFERLISKERLNISKVMLADSRRMTFQKALMVLGELGDAEKREVIGWLEGLSLSDGTCVPLEAMLIMAVREALLHRAKVYSVPSHSVTIPNMTVLYVENESDTACGRFLAEHGSEVRDAFSRSGLNFVYIPHIVEDYAGMDAEYLTKVIAYMIPTLPAEKVEAIRHHLCTITTPRFCRDVLYKKVGLDLLGARPSLLVKINESLVLGPHELVDASKSSFSNYLCVELEAEPLAQVRRMLDDFRQRVNCQIAVNPVEASPKFLYYGFHRALFDLISYEKELQEYKLRIDVKDRACPICFVQLDDDSVRIPLRLSTHEAALYVMMVEESMHGGRGLDWRERMTAGERKLLVDRYNRIYTALGKGRRVEQFKDRTRVNHIKGALNALHAVANVAMFVPRHLKGEGESFYRVDLDDRYLDFNA